MADLLKGNACIGQSGGPTSVINQSLVGVIEAIQHAPVIDRLLGARHGVRGIVEEKFIDLKSVPFQSLERVADTPAAALGSTRDKPDKAYCEKIFDIFSRNNIRYFFYIGGNDSADTARIINELAMQAKYELRVFHIPKTIDNDLRVTDHCPGYGSAAKFVACAVMGDDRDNASLPGVKIDVIMGRHAGWLTAASTLGRQDESDGPHLVYFPERRISPDKMLADIDAVNRRLGRCVVAVSEGIEDEDGAAWAQKIALGEERDAHGNIQLSGTGALADYLCALVRDKLKIKRVRGDTFGYLQRSFAGFASPVDRMEARMVGNSAVHFVMDGNRDGSVALRRTGEGDQYACECFLASLADVARQTKDLPEEFIDKNGHDVTEAFRSYALPLTGGLPKMGKLF
jgi:6-phosphofructokinase 1